MKRVSIISRRGCCGSIPALYYSAADVMMMNHDMSIQRDALVIHHVTFADCRLGTGVVVSVRLEGLRYFSEL